MAALETTVRSPYGEVYAIPGRKPREELLEEARKHLQREIIRLEEHLREVDNWSVETHRGSTRAMSYEECVDKGVRP